MALTWIWLSKVNGPALPKERCIKVDKAPPEKIGSEKKLLTIEFFFPKSEKILNNFWKLSHNRVP
jgi:hypothetical protein